MGLDSALVQLLCADVSCSPGPRIVLPADQHQQPQLSPGDLKVRLIEKFEEPSAYSRLQIVRREGLGPPSLRDLSSCEQRGQQTDIAGGRAGAIRRDLLKLLQKAWWGSAQSATKV